MNRFLFLCLAVSAHAATVPGKPELIPLTADTIARIGVAFAPVQAAAAGSGPRFPGTVIPSPESVSTLSAPLPGVIERWLAAPGAAVAAAQPLALIRSPEALRLQQEWMAAAAAQETAQAELTKLTQLKAAGLVATPRVVAAQRAAEQAAFGEQAAATALRRIGFTPERLGALRRQGEGLGYYSLVSPIAATLARRSGAAGDFIEANRELVRLQGAQLPWVSLLVPARHAAGLRPGQRLKVNPGGEELVLRQVDQGIDERSQTVDLKAEFLAPPRLLAGQIVMVALPVPPDGLLVPGSAVVHRGHETTIYVRAATGVESRVVTLQPLGADYLATAGVQPGDVIVVRGAAVLKGIQAGFGQSE